MVDLTSWFNFGVPTVLLVGLVTVLGWLLRQAIAGVHVVWEYLTGSGDGKDKPPGIVTQMKDRHLAFLAAMERAINTSNELNESLVRMTQDGFEALQKKIDALADGTNEEVTREVLRTMASALETLGTRANSETVMFAVQEVRQMLKKEEKEHPNNHPL